MEALDYGVCTRPEDQRYALLLRIITEEHGDSLLLGVVGEVANLPDDSLRFLQAIAGGKGDGGCGFVDVISRDLSALNEAIVEAGSPPLPINTLDAWVSDEGLHDGSPFNPVASAMLGQRVHGSVVLCSSDERGETIGMDERTAMSLSRAIADLVETCGRELAALAEAGLSDSQHTVTVMDPDDLTDPDRIEEIEARSRRMLRLLDQRREAVAMGDEGMQRAIDDAIAKLEAEANGEG